MMMPVRVRCVRSLPAALLMPKSSTFTVTAWTSPAATASIDDFRIMMFSGFMSR